MWAGGFIPYPIDAKVEDDVQSGMYHITLGNNVQGMATFSSDFLP